MRSLLLCFILLSGLCSPVSSIAAEGPYGKVRLDEITSIYDGDTFRATIRDWPAVIGRRVPVRIALDPLPEGLLLAAGTTCTVVLEDARGERSWWDAFWQG